MGEVTVWLNPQEAWAIASKRYERFSQLTKSCGQEKSLSVRPTSMNCGSIGFKPFGKAAFRCPNSRASPSSAILFPESSMLYQLLLKNTRARTNFKGESLSLLFGVVEHSTRLTSCTKTLPVLTSLVTDPQRVKQGSAEEHSRDESTKYKVP